MMDLVTTSGLSAASIASLCASCFLNGEIPEREAVMPPRDVSDFAIERRFNPAEDR